MKQLFKVFIEGKKIDFQNLAEMLYEKFMKNLYQGKKGCGQLAGVHFSLIT